MSIVIPDVPGYVRGAWTIDSAHSHVGFVVTHLMVSKVRGAFAEFEGTIETGDSPANSKVVASIRTSSVDTKNDTRDDQIRSDDFLDVEKHPTMTFESTSVRSEGAEWRIDGNLSIRGTTKAVALVVESGLFGLGFDGKPKLGLSASTVINRLDFGVNVNAPVPRGGLFLADNVTIVLDIEADLRD